MLVGHKRADLAITNGQVVDVFRGETRRADVAVRGSRIVKVGDIGDCIGPETRTIDAGGRFVTPGLIESHAHSYHSNLSPTEYARICLARGTTAVAESFYGQGQIRGLPAVRFFYDELRRTPINVLFQVPVLAYLQNVELGLPSTMGAPDGRDLLDALGWDGCVGLEEPPYIPMLEKDPLIARLVDEALARGLLVMGHGAGLAGNDLAAYASMGVTADHECISAEEAVERINLGVMVSMRETPIARNQRDVQRAITEHGCDPAGFMFCSDVPDAVSFVRVGHIDECIRIAVEGGVAPIAAVQMATLNPARYYRVDHDLGSVTPGRQADILLVDDLRTFNVETVIVKGQPVVVDGEFVARLEQPLYPEFLRHTVKLSRAVTADDLWLAAPDGRGSVTLRVIGAETLLSDERHISVDVSNGSIGSDVDQDVLKVAMFDRYARWPEAGIGFIQGYGLARGAIGTSYNPFYNNVMVLGTNDADMAVAANAVADLGGGFVAVEGGEVRASVALPLCGLLSDEPADVVVPELERLYEVVADMGCTMPWPFHNLAFTAVVGELPFLKMSDRGPFDVVKRELLSPIVE